ncbi:MAG: type III pantothenate kinase [Desulfobacterales bacterium]|nr:type III pantothenate kinase [Desulfobacterales bacterium]
MLLVIDVGNTNIVMGIYKSDELIYTFRIRTIRDTTYDEFSVLVNNLLSTNGINLKEIKKIVVSSVVPHVVPFLDSFCRKYIGITPYFVNAETFTGMPILYKNPKELGSDRIVNCFAAFHKYQTSLIVIDFGTATTFDAVSSKGEFLGGVIAPGIKISSEALFQKASKLPAIEMEKPKDVIGRDTISCMQSGIIYGYAGLVDGLVKRVKKEMNESPKVIATGGLASLMMEISETIEFIEPSLILDGLKLIKL